MSIVVDAPAARGFSLNRPVLALLLIAFVGVPLFASPYVIEAILLPFLALSLAGLGLNLLTGYGGQVSLGSAATA